MKSGALAVRLDDRTATIRLIVRPVLHDDDPARGFFLVLFDEVPEGPAAGHPAATTPSAGDPARQLEAELVRVKGQLRATVEQHETQAEELKASNEELQAMNEELRSSAEELETSKEELQSLNEELRTVDQELKHKIEEVSQANNDIRELDRLDRNWHGISRSSVSHQAVYPAGPECVHADPVRSGPASVWTSAAISWTSISGRTSSAYSIAWSESNARSSRGAVTGS